MASLNSITVNSQLCPLASNISINVAVVDPAEAHSGYDHDERVIALIAHGIGQPDTAEIVRQRCTWLETMD